jgi:mannose-6-phosphate isomerase-like protein (cupin superfamily)
MEAIDINRYRGQFFQVLQTTKQSQTAVMTIAPGADAGPAEAHDGDQVIYVIEGEATVTVDGQTLTVRPGTLVTIPAHARHHVRNAGSMPVFFLTIYAPPEY